MIQSKITGQYDDEEGNNIAKIDYGDGFKFVGQIGYKVNPSGIPGGLTEPLNGKIYYNNLEIYSGDIYDNIERLFEIYKPEDKSKK